MDSSCFVRYLSKTEVNYFTPGFWLQTAYSGAVFAPTFLLHFIFLFTYRKLSVVFVSGLYLISIIFEIFNLSSSSLFFKKVSFIAPGNLHIETGPLYSLFLAYVLAALLAGLIMVYEKYRISKGRVKEQMKYYMFAAVVIPGAAVFYSFSTAMNYQIRFDNLFLVGYASIIACTITKRELFQIKIVISRTVSYGLTCASVVIIFMLINFHIKSPDAKLWFNLFYCIMCAIIVPKVREKFQTWLEEKYLSDYYESKKVIDEITKDITGQYERAGIFRTLMKAIESVIKVKASYLLILEKETGKGRQIFKLYDQHMIEVSSFEADSPVIRFFQENQAPIRLEWLDHDSQQELLQYMVNKYSVLIPLYSPPDLFDGALIVGQKLSESAYTRKDFNLFKTIMDYTKAILDRIRPYEEIKKEYEENREQLYEARIMAVQARKNEDMAFTIQEYNHEIRTPLTMLTHDIEFLPDTEKKLNWEKLKRLKREMKKNVHRINDIVATTLRLTPDSIKEKKRKKMPQGINEIIGQALSLYTFENKVEVINYFNVEEVYVEGVKGELERIFLNLIRNADEAMPEGGVLRIRTSLHKEEACVEIKDTGMGIPEKDRQKVWEIHRSRHVTKGRGLGLSIVHRLVLEHQGRISLASEEGEGTTFTIFFPAINTSW
ncbi:MAG: hypothetical protein GY718_09255 [Lentisphaerae bacterium]|nr:hypothetical protein [Lentisphaerota bacterium]